MKRYQTLTSKLAILSVLLVLSLTGKVVAQTTQSQPQTDANPQQSQPAQPNAAPDLRFLGLSQDQIQKIRAINAELKDERQQAGLRLRQARRALAEAVESPTPDEALISQRSRELAEAQAVTIRLRSLTEARILQVLTPDQRARLREIRQRNQELGRMGQQQPNGLGPRRLQRRANANLTDPNQRRLQRRQQKP